MSSTIRNGVRVVGSSMRVGAGGVLETLPGLHVKVRPADGEEAEPAAPFFLRVHQKHFRGKGLAVNAVGAAVEDEAVGREPAKAPAAAWGEGAFGQGHASLPVGVGEEEKRCAVHLALLAEHRGGLTVRMDVADGDAARE